MFISDIPTILCEYTGAGHDASSTYRYLLDITYEEETSKKTKVADVVQAVLEELSDQAPAFNLAETDFGTLKVQIRLVSQVFSTRTESR